MSIKPHFFSLFFLYVVEYRMVRFCEVSSRSDLVSSVQIGGAGS